MCTRGGEGCGVSVGVSMSDLAIGSAPARTRAVTNRAAERRRRALGVERPWLREKVRKSGGKGGRGRRGRCWA